MDNVSRTSLAQSIKFNTTNFNMLSSIPKSLIQSIKREGEAYLKANIFALEFWKQIRKTDFTTNGVLNYKITEQLY